LKRIRAGEYRQVHDDPLKAYYERLVRHTPERKAVANGKDKEKANRKAGITDAVLRNIGQAPQEFQRYAILGDLKADSAFTSAIGRLVERGVIEGLGNGRYRKLTTDPTKTYYGQLKHTTRAHRALAEQDSPKPEEEGGESITHKALRQLANLAQQFTQEESEIPFWLLETMRKRGVIERLERGKYKRSSEDPLKDYYARSPVAEAKSRQTKADLSQLRIFPYGDDGEVLIYDGKRVFLGTEIILVRKTESERRKWQNK
jgi:hypothetical protein